jgi:hypothetical protein
VKSKGLGVRRDLLEVKGWRDILKNVGGWRIEARV